MTSIEFRQITAHDLWILYLWLNRHHVAEAWHSQGTYAEIERDFLPLTQPNAHVKGYFAIYQHELVGFVQCYVVKGAGEGWWEDEVDEGARGIDQFLANAEDLGKGLGTAMVRAFTDYLFQDPTVSKIQTDPAPHNKRAIRCYEQVGFRAQGEVITPDGLALLMIKNR